MPAKEHGIVNSREMVMQSSDSGDSSLNLGTVTINSASVTATSSILVLPRGASAVTGLLGISAIVPGVSFTVLSGNPLDDRDVNWWIF